MQSFYFDRGLYLFCGKIESEMDMAEIGKKTAAEAMHARQKILDKYINPSETKGQFRDPALTFGKKKEQVNQEFVIGGDRFNG